jgi:uncharacterized protein (DUF58 family)
MIARIGWAVWLVLLYILSLMSGASMLQYLLVLFLPLVAASFAVTVFASRMFSLSASKETVGHKGEEIAVPLVAENRFPLPLPCVTCVLEGENRLTGETFRQALRFSVAGRTRKKLDAAFSSKYCGRIELKIKQIRFYEWFGLLFFPCKCEQNVGVTVLPEVFDMQLIADLHRGCPEDSDEYSTRTPGNDMSEIFDVRDYRPGDSIRQIHWKLTQKFDHLMTKEASLPIDRSILLVFDTVRPKEHHTSPACYDAAADVLVSLSQALLTLGISHTVAWRDAGSGGISLASVAATEDLTGVLPYILEGGYDDGVSTIEAYMTEKNTLGISQIFEVCCAVPAVPGANFEVETSVLCAKSGKSGDMPDGVVYFSPKTYRDELSSLLL